MERIKEVFRIADLSETQIKAFTALLSGKDVFVSTRTGGGKSLIYQGVPFLFDVTDPIILIVTPLIAIMEEQCLYLRSLGLEATYLGKDQNEDEDILSGKFRYVFGSPEHFLGTEKYRHMIRNPIYQKRLLAIAIDEAHVVDDWGEASKDSEDPFREWYGRIGEMRSLCPSSRVIALTATASKRVRYVLKKKLALHNCEEIVQSCDRPNVKLNVVKRSSSERLEDMFSMLIELLKVEGDRLDRTIIFCRTMASASRVYLAFKNGAGEDNIDMFHSATPESVKQKVRDDMNNYRGKTRVLIGTSAAGMGVNFKGVNRVINFGPPQNMDSLVQQLGRAGREGGSAEHVLLFYGAQLSHVSDEEIRTYLKTSECRRQFLLSLYDSTKGGVSDHNCCDNCATSCECDEIISHSPHPFIQKEVSREPVRAVSDSHISKLKDLLSNIDTSSVESILPLSNIESFSAKSLESVIEKLPFIEDRTDVLDMCSVWSLDQADYCMFCINSVFDE